MLNYWTHSENSTCLSWRLTFTKRILELLDSDLIQRSLWSSSKYQRFHLESSILLGETSMVSTLGSEIFLEVVSGWFCQHLTTIKGIRWLNSRRIMDLPTLRNWRIRTSQNQVQKELFWWDLVKTIKVICHSCNTWILSLIWCLLMKELIVSMMHLNIFSLALMRTQQAWWIQGLTTHKRRAMVHGDQLPQENLEL